MGFQKNIDTLHGAPALVVLTTVNDRSGYERDGSFSTSKGTHWQSFDAGLAAEAFCVAAHDAGLGTVILGIYDEGNVKAVLNLPETESVSALIPIGVPAESPAPPSARMFRNFCAFDNRLINIIQFALVLNCPLCYDKGNE